LFDRGLDLRPTARHRHRHVEFERHGVVEHVHRLQYQRRLLDRLVVAGHRSPDAGHVERTVDDLLDLIRRLVFRHQIAVVAQVLDHRVRHDAVRSERLADRRYLEHADLLVLEFRVVERLDLDALVVAIDQHERRAVQRCRELGAFGIGGHVHPQIAVALRQRAAHQAALDRRAKVVLHAGAECLAEHLGDLVLETFTFLVRQRHVAGIRAYRQRAEFFLRGRAACRDQQASGQCSMKQHLHVRTPLGGYGSDSGGCGRIPCPEKDSCMRARNNRRAVKRKTPGA